ncbi:hypothetical protein GCM10007269_15300 [Microbacterium murale]|uniref:Uncharacterized protein n=1 Tax=Microbacterium murale TaxID=1081040 RepID=A0ABQ1RKE3_9MICO|nr:hypothetical protein GCM10007269_15300 [Microbacterium murale]
MFGGADGEYSASQPRHEAFYDTRTLHVAQRGRRAEVKTELYARVGGVDTLPARPRRARELLDQITRGNPETVRSSRSRRHTQIIHSTSVPQCDESWDATDGRIV